MVLPWSLLNTLCIPQVFSPLTAGSQKCSCSVWVTPGIIWPRAVTPFLHLEALCHLTSWRSTLCMCRLPFIQLLEGAPGEISQALPLHSSLLPGALPCKAFCRPDSDFCLLTSGMLPRSPCTSVCSLLPRSKMRSSWTRLVCFLSLKDDSLERHIFQSLQMVVSHSFSSLK